MSASLPHGYSIIGNILYSPETVFRPDTGKDEGRRKVISWSEEIAPERILHIAQLDAQSRNQALSAAGRRGHRQKLTRTIGGLR